MGGVVAVVVVVFVVSLLDAQLASSVVCFCVSVAFFLFLFVGSLSDDNLMIAASPTRLAW